MKRIIQTMTAITFLIAANFAVGQAAPDYDLLAAPPELVVVEKVDTALGQIVIDGQTFELYDGDRSLFALPPEAVQNQLSLGDLRPGAELMVITDGTVSTDDRLAKIIALWRPK